MLQKNVKKVAFVTSICYTTTCKLMSEENNLIYLEKIRCSRDFYENAKNHLGDRISTKFGPIGVPSTVSSLEPDWEVGSKKVISSKG